MICRDCGHEQESDGRFCSRCGCLLSQSDPLDQPPADAPNGGGLRFKAAAAVGVLVLSALTAVGLQGDVLNRVSTDVPDGNVEVVLPEPETRTPSPSAVPSPQPTQFAEPTGTTLLFATGLEAATAIDLDTGRLTDVTVPGLVPGDHRYRLWQAGDSVVAGWGEIWASMPGREGSARKLGDATIFVPDADPDRVWLIDYEGDRVGVGDVTWSLVDVADGQVVHSTEGDADLFAVRGSASGLVLTGRGGLSVYDPMTDETSPYLDADARYVTDVTMDHVVWCGQACRTLVIEGTEGPARPIDGGSDGAFHPNAVWLSNDGSSLAALTPVRPEIEPSLVIFDARTGDQVFQGDPLPTVSVEGTWTDDGQFFYAFRAAGTGGLPPRQIVGYWSPQSDEQIQTDLPPTGSGAFVAHPSCALAETFDRVTSPTPATCPGSAGPQTTRVDVTIREDETSGESVFTAPDPRQHQQFITMEVTPAEEIVSFTLAADRDLHVGTSDGCPVQQGSARCEMRLPTLEARQPGEWTAVVQRDSPGPAVDVSIRIEWIPVQDGS